MLGVGHAQPSSHPQRQSQSQPQPQPPSAPPRGCPTISITDSLEAKRTIYVGGLGQGSADERVIQEVFSVCGPILSVKLVDKSTPTHENVYAFVQYEDSVSAEQAIDLLNGRTLALRQIKVNWAFQGSVSASARAETASHYTIFVGDLAAEINDDWLYRAFEGFGSISDARVLWDMQTGRSRGYGFVSFRDRREAEHALDRMNGVRLGSRNIRTNWANLMKSTPPERDMLPRQSNGPGSRQELSVGDILASSEYRRISDQTPEDLRTVYLGNLAPDVDENDIEPLFSAEASIGGAAAATHLELVGIKCFSDRGFAFSTLRTHAQAALAIVILRDRIVKGRPLKVKWQNRPENASPTLLEQGHYQSPLQTPAIPHTSSASIGGPSHGRTPSVHATAAAAAAAAAAAMSGFVPLTPYPVQGLGFNQDIVSGRSSSGMGSSYTHFSSSPPRSHRQQSSMSDRGAAFAAAAAAASAGAAPGNPVNSRSRYVHSKPVGHQPRLSMSTKHQHQYKHDQTDGPNPLDSPDLRRYERNILDLQVGQPDWRV
ncbi:RRM [Savitreella phatthalungensis]